MREWIRYILDPKSPVATRQIIDSKMMDGAQHEHVVFFLCWFVLFVLAYLVVVVVCSSHCSCSHLW